jgi:hypothetical protein
LRYWLAALCALAASMVAADDGRSAGRHEYGSDSLSIAVDGPGMVIGLDGPAVNFVGCEGRPSTPAQTAALARTLDVLRAGDALFLTPPAADCRMLSAAVSPPDYAAAGDAELKASWDFRCGNPSALLWVDAQLLARFPRTDQLRTSVVTPAGHKTVVLTPGTPRVLLPRRYRGPLSPRISSTSISAASQSFSSLPGANPRRSALK